MDQIEIQSQDTTGGWRTFHVTQDSSLLITMAMKQLDLTYSTGQTANTASPQKRGKLSIETLC